jgi:hypothetical protein
MLAKAKVAWRRKMAAKIDEKLKNSGGMAAAACGGRKWAQSAWRQRQQTLHSLSATRMLAPLQHAPCSRRRAHAHRFIDACAAARCALLRLRARRAWKLKSETS